MTTKICIRGIRSNLCFNFDGNIRVGQVRVFRLFNFFNKGRDEDVTTRSLLVSIYDLMMKLLKFYLLFVNFILEFLHNLRFFLMIFVDKYTAMNLLIYK